MNRIAAAILLGLTALGVSSCDNLSEVKDKIDHLSFENTGGTLFSKPNRVTTKELHFDTGVLLGRVVILEGEIIEVGDYETFLVVSDDAGRMLVVLTNIDDASQEVKDSQGSRVKVLGSVERGKKGLPFILANSINIHKK